MAESDILKLGARPLRLAELRRVYEGPVTVGIAPEALGAVRAAHLLTARLAAGLTASGHDVQGQTAAPNLNVVPVPVVPEDCC